MDTISVDDFNRMMDAAMTERAFRDWLVAELKQAGWAVWFVWNSRHSPKGWLDIEALRPPRMIKAELKTMKGTLTKEQKETIALLAHFPWVECYVWRPSDRAAILEIIR